MKDQLKTVDPVCKKQPPIVCKPQQKPRRNTCSEVKLRKRLFHKDPSNIRCCNYNETQRELSERSVGKKHGQKDATDKKEQPKETDGEVIVCCNNQIQVRNQALYRPRYFDAYKLSSLNNVKNNEIATRILKLLC